MNNSDEILIEHYLDKELTSSELHEFELRLETDQDFREELSASIAARKLVTEAGRLDFKDRLESFDRQINDTSVAPKVIPLWMKRALPIAAMLIVFIGVYQFFILNASLTNYEAFDMHFESYSGPTSLRDTPNNNTVNWDLASAMYLDKNYKGALSNFDLAENEIPDVIRNFYIAISAMSMSEPDNKKALNNFDLVLQSDNDYKEQALWYKGLLLLKMKRTEAANNIFKEIIATGSFKAAKAQQILDLKIKD